MLKDSFNEVLDPQTLKALEFENLLNVIARYAVSQPAKEEVLYIRPLTQKDSILYRQSLINDLRSIIQQGNTLPIEPFEDLKPIFKALKPADAVLMPEELLKMVPFLSSVVETKAMGKLLSDGPLKEYIQVFNDHEGLLTEIKRCINPDGSISDDASLYLKEIRKQIRSLRNRIKKLLERILQDPEKLHHIQDTYITERNGRYVIPVKADHKGHIKGIIHDVSNTEATVFVEPQETVSLGNELENLIAEEKIEIWRILRQLSELLRERLGPLSSDYDRIVYLDSLWAVARFSELAGMCIPEITDKPEIVIRQGRHPLLWNHLRENNLLDKLVPLDFELGIKFRCLIITGSNAGGKTVSLKTVGLLTVMALSGLPVPAKEGSRFYLFKKVMADIGDEQSIEASLSTFSGHLFRMKEMLE
ncbi:MAG: endonuclease MutS2, partial [Nitrospirae bacterium]